MIWLASTFVVAVGAWLFGRVVVPIQRRRRNARQRELDQARGLPTAVVLLQLSVRSGVHPRSALAAVSTLPVTSGPLCAVTQLLADVHQRLELGADLTSAMLATENASPDAQRVLDALRRAEIDGGPLANHLEVLMSDLRRQRRTALDSAAQRLTVSMLFPLVLCILPAFVLLAVVPLVNAALQGLPG